MKTLIRMLSLGGIVAAISLGALATASAHADLDHSDPAAGAVLASSPASVTLTFVEEIQHTSGTYGIAVTNAGGQSVTTGGPTIGSDSMSLSIALVPNLLDGTYTVTWSNVSTDGHALTDETFSFSVGTAAGVPAAPADGAPPHAHTHDDMATVPSGPADAPTTGQIVIAMAVQNDSSIDGRAEIVPLDGGSKTQISVFLNGVTDDSMHADHVHVSATCNEGPHLADLNDVVASGTPHGRSVTIVNVPFSVIANGKNIILAHGKNAIVANGDADAVVACGKIPAQPAAGVAAAPASLPKALPSTGSAGSGNRSATLMSLVGLALAGTMIAAGGVAFARRGNG